MSPTSDTRVRHRSLRFGLLEAILVASLGVGFLVYLRSDTDARDVVAREERGLAFLRSVFAAETAYRTAARRDADRDGKPEFGGLADLAAAGLVTEPLSSDEGGTFAERDGYRFEVLLPAGELPNGRRAWSRSDGRIDTRLASSTFAVVALPSPRGPRVLRGFYLDGAGYGYAVEGVYSPDRDPVVPPPLHELRAGDKGEDGGHAGGPAWRPFETPGAASVESPGK